MDNDVLKMLPKKAFDLISVKETIYIGAKLTKSIVDKNSYQKMTKDRLSNWKLEDIRIVDSMENRSNVTLGKADGEKILKIYFTQFFDSQKNVHIDLRKSHFSMSDTFYWIPSKLHYTFSSQFYEGVRELYTGFYFADNNKFERGLILLGIIRTNMEENKKMAIIKIFLEHFGEGKEGEVDFSLKKLQNSFNAIFSFFVKEDIPLNPEFAVLGVMLVTLYTTLEEIPYKLNVRQAFIEVFDLYPIC